MAPTLKDIAQQSGYSVPTVSCVLNGKGHLFKEGTRRRILSLAKELGYRPNTLARTLAGKRTGVIGYVDGTPNYARGASSTFMATIMEGVDHQLWQRGYRISVGFCLHRPERFDEYLRDFANQRVEGLILSQPTYWGRWVDTEKIGQLVPAFLPMVTVGKLQGLNCAEIGVDREKGMSMLAEYAGSLGHRRFAFVVSRIKSNRAKYEGLVKTLGRFGLAPDAMPVFEEIGTFESARDQAFRILNLDPRPTFVFCSNDLVAAGLIRGLSQLGITVPRDISVSGFDDMYLASLWQPAITTVRQPFEKLGRSAADLLLELIQAKVPWPQSADRRVALEPSLVVRQSTAPIH